jgi:hypothetical protein
MRNQMHRKLQLAIGATLLNCAPSFADVLQIGADGSVSTYSRPSVFTNKDVLVIPTPHVKAVPAPSEKTPPASAVAQLINEAAGRYSVSSSLIEAVAWQESRFRQAALSPKGAVGIMQLKNETARELGVDANDTRQNVLGGTAYLRWLLDRYSGNVPLAIAAYNAGPGAVDRHGGIPPFKETQAYVAAIVSALPNSAIPTADTARPSDTTSAAGTSLLLLDH